MLVPGETGWEIWSGSSATGFTLLSTAPTARAGEITGLPSGDVILLFPVRALTALPLKVNTEDASLFPELAAMHAERQGLRPDPMAGQLTDQFVVAKDGENSTLLSVVLRTPGDGEMPARTPKEFDLSARAVPYQGDSLVLWREFGRWVFAVSVGGKLAYCQATGIEGPAPDGAVVREMRLALIQMSLQGLDCRAERVVVYDSAQPPVGALETAFGIPVQIFPKPAPVLPDPRSHLLPDDVRAARKHAQRRRQMIAAAALVGIAYLGTLGWFGYDYWMKDRKVSQLRAEAGKVAPQRMAYQQHVAKWDELESVVDLGKSPVELLYRVVSSIPSSGGGAGGVRLKSADIDGNEIKVVGQAPQPGPVKQFDLALHKSDQLSAFTWENQEPAQTNKGWDFVFTGRTAQAGTQRR
ncbi:hypothetical protein llg_37440 [Luteolibacter sp. LG18]|nr:hypothetical protein llg_37440 [Luteolibacter sp. LG18]